MVKDVFDKLNYKVVAAVATCRTLGMVGTGTRTPEEEATTPAGSMTGKRRRGCRISEKMGESIGQLRIHLQSHGEIELRTH